MSDGAARRQQNRRHVLFLLLPPPEGLLKLSTHAKHFAFLTLKTDVLGDGFVAFRDIFSIRLVHSHILLLRILCFDRFFKQTSHHRKRAGTSKECGGIHGSAILRRQCNQLTGEIADCFQTLKIVFKYFA